MPCVDRTRDFLALADKLAASGVVVARTEPTRSTQSEYNVLAGEIGSEIHRVQLKMAELSKLVKGRKLYNDNTAQAQEVAFTLKQDIQLLDVKIAQLEAKSRGGENKHTSAHSVTIAGTLKQRLLEVTKEFKDILELQTKNLQKEDARMNKYKAKRQAPVAFDAPAGYDPESGEVLQGSSAQMYHSSRSEAVQSVQRVIGELGQMFGKMAELVHSQEEMISRIDKHTDDALHNLTEGQSELLRYFHNISSNRSLILKVFSILIFFVVFFIIFLS